MAGGAEAERHHGDDLVGVVDQHRPARVTEAGSAATSDLARVVQGMQIPALGDVAVDLDDPRGRLVPRLHIHGLRLHRLDAVPDVLDQGTVPVPAGAAGQRLGGTQRRQLTEGGDGSVLVQLDDAHVVVDGEPGEVVVVGMGVGRSRDVVGVGVQPRASGVVERFLGGVVGTGWPAGKHLGVVEGDPDVGAATGQRFAIRTEHHLAVGADAKGAMAGGEERVGIQQGPRAAEPSRFGRVEEDHEAYVWVLTRIGFAIGDGGGGARHHDHGSQRRNQ